MSEKQIYGAVLLVCIYNRYGNVITHDYFYQLFSQYGQIVKILIFEKAKVWKTFIEFVDKQSAKKALINLDNRVVFEDGSKMNIFSSKLKHIKLQNSNLGGVNYQQLRLEHESERANEPGIRARTYTNPSFCSKFLQVQQTEHLISFNKVYEHQQRTINTFKSSQNKNSSDSYHSFSIDQQFLQLARQSQEFRQLEKSNIKTRMKSKTLILNPNMEQFLKENSPCKVLFVRSIPQVFTNKNLYNIFSNFGNVKKVIHLKQKGNGLVEFQSIEDAITAKDQLNYAKPQMKVFYSHYETLNMSENEGEIYSNQKRENQNKNKFVNPPSQILYLTMVTPQQQQEIRQKCHQIGVQIYKISWSNNNNRWSCLADFGTVDNSLLVMGLLQGQMMSSGKPIKLSFTRHKLNKTSQCT